MGTKPSIVDSVIVGFGNAEPDSSIASFQQFFPCDFDHLREVGCYPVQVRREQGMTAANSSEVLPREFFNRSVNAEGSNDQSPDRPTIKEVSQPRGGHVLLVQAEFLHCI